MYRVDVIKLVIIVKLDAMNSAIIYPIEKVLLVILTSNVNRFIRISSIALRKLKLIINISLMNVVTTKRVLRMQPKLVCLGFL